MKFTDEEIAVMKAATLFRSWGRGRCGRRLRRAWNVIRRAGRTPYAPHEQLWGFDTGWRAQTRRAARDIRHG